MNERSENRHPDLAELDLVRTGEASAEVSVHASSCADCQKHLAQLQELDSELRLDLELTPRPDADQDVLSFIRAHASSIQKSPQSIIPWRRAILAAAAIIALCLALVWMRGLKDVDDRGTQPPEIVRKEDINGDGTVDIIDAYLLASRIEAKGTLASEWDLNADGEVDQSDVDLLADQAVALAGEGR